MQLWWLVLLHLPVIANTVAVTLFKRIAHTHDWELADDLPQTAGEWLRDRARVFDVTRLLYLPLIIAIGGGLIT